MIAVSVLLLAAIVAARVTLACLLHHQYAPALACLLATLLLLWPVRRLAWAGRRLPRNRARVMRWRIRFGVKPGPDHANWVELVWQWGRFAAWRRSKQERRSLGTWRRYWHPYEHALLVGWAQLIHRLWVPLEEHLLILAGPRKGKSGWLATLAPRWPGPAIFTSTKPDLFGLTSGIRQRRCGPVYTFNPQDPDTECPSNFAWSPLTGADVEAVAIRRADQFAASVSHKGVEDVNFWTDQCSAFLRALFLAGALGGADMRLVYRWVMDERAVPEAVAILHAHGRHDWGDTAQQICGEARKTVATVRMSMARALSFLADPKLAQCVLPGPGGGFDIPAFLRSRGTLYMIASPAGSKDQAPVSGLFAALASEIRYQATLLAAQTPGKRLDPPLLMALDEACQICPCPIPSWVADSGGKGITIVTVAHGLAQLRDQYSADAAQTIVDCAGTLMLFGGTKDPHTLDLFSRLCGPSSYDQQSRRRGEPGQSHLTEHPMMTDAMIRRLPRSHTLLVRDDASPVISRAPLAWRDLRMAWAKATGRAVAKVQPLAAALPVPAGPVHLAPWPAPAGPVQDTLPVPVPPGSASLAPASNGHNGNGNGHGPAGGGSHG